nr:MAG TPA: hypothetical protein [Caudoviricetes sp.]
MFSTAPTEKTDVDINAALIADTNIFLIFIKLSSKNFHYFLYFLIKLIHWTRRLTFNIIYWSSNPYFYLIIQYFSANHANKINT